MECKKFENYLREHACSAATVPEVLQQHLRECTDCKNYSRFAAALIVQNGALEKAPEDMLPAIEKRIIDRLRCRKKERVPLFRPLFKPAFAGFFALLLAVASYVCLSHHRVGNVENLSKRFKITQFENINSGDMLYAGDNTTASIRLKSNSTLQIHQNTIIKVDGMQNLSLSRGEVSLQAGDRELRIVTPGGMVLAKNAKAKISSVSKLSNGAVATEITCMVFEGQLTIQSTSTNTTLRQGQKAVIAESGSITGPQQLTSAEFASEKDIAVHQKLFAAVELLCDCITTPDYAPGKKADHLRLFGKEVDENKFRVRVFWQEKTLNGLVVGPSNENNTIFSIQPRRIRA